MTDSPDFVPDGFLKEIFSYYGLTSSAFILFSGVVVSGLGLQDIFNPVIWLASACFALVIGYSLRHVIPRRFPVVLVFSLIVAGVVCFYSIQERLFPTLFPPQVYTDPVARILISAAPLFAISLTFAISVVSYKKHDSVIPQSIAPSIHSQLQSQILDNPLFYESFSSRIILDYDKRASKVRLDSEISMKVRNRDPENRTFFHRYPRITPNFRLHEVRVNQRAKEIDNPRFHSGDAVHLDDKITGKGAIVVDSRMTEIFPNNGSELYTAYSYPAANFEISLLNECPERIEAWIEVLNDHDEEIITENSYLVWRSKKGILPYQGTRVVWRLIQDKKA